MVLVVPEKCTVIDLPSWSELWEESIDSIIVYFVPEIPEERGEPGSCVYEKTWVHTSGRGECEGGRVGGESETVYEDIGEGVERGCSEIGKGVCL